MSMFYSWKSLKMCLKLFVLSQGKEDAQKCNFVSSVHESTRSNTAGRVLEERSLSGSADLKGFTFWEFSQLAFKSSPKMLSSWLFLSFDPLYKVFQLTIGY